MTHSSHNRPAHRRVDHTWVFAAWGVPIAVAVVITVLTAGFGVIAIPVAFLVGLTATVLHFAARRD